MEEKQIIFHLLGTCPALLVIAGKGIADLTLTRLTWIITHLLFSW